jgi:carbamoyltransferase
MTTRLSDSSCHISDLERAMCDGFNVRGEPIVCAPEDAFRCFIGSEIVILVVENCHLQKEDQDPALKLEYQSAFELD